MSICSGVAEDPISARFGAGNSTAEVSTPFHDSLATLAQRTQDADLLRPDLVPDNLMWIMAMLTSTLWTMEPGTNGWRRYLALIFEGLTPATAKPLPAPAALLKGRTDGQLVTLIPEHQRGDADLRASIGAAGFRRAIWWTSWMVDSWEPWQEAPGGSEQSDHSQLRSWVKGFGSRPWSWRTHSRIAGIRSASGAVIGELCSQGAGTAPICCITPRRSG